MARMFPKELPDEIRQDRKRAAECKVFYALEKQLDESYRVFYSSPWLGTRPDGREVDGEADFVIAHPKHGMLVVEVKGGRISIDNEGQWRSKDRDGITFKIKDPVKQAHDGKHTLIRKIRSSELWDNRWIHARHGVILPSVAPESKAFRPNMPIKIFGFDEDMDRLDCWVMGRFGAVEDNDRPGANAFGNLGIQVLDDLITRPIQTRVRLKTNIDEDLNEIRILTEEQYWTLKDLEKNRRLAIAGAAGTGKTVLAIKKARMLADEGKSVLLLCFNAPLGGYLAAELEDFSSVTATHFHKFFGDVVAKAARKKDQPAPPSEDLGDSELANMLIDCFVEAGYEEFNAVVIDEGQDFSDEWLKALEAVVEGGDEGVLYIFFDNNQNVMSKNGEYLDSLNYPKYQLSRNFRNTKCVFRAANTFYRGDFVRPVGPEGTAIRWVHAETINATKSALVERIGDLTANHNVRHEEIVVLAPDIAARETLLQKGRLGRRKVCRAGELVAGAITVDSIRRFKGLESPVIFLILGLERDLESELLYTAMTRSQSILEVVGPAMILRNVQKLIAE